MTCGAASYGWHRLLNIGIGALDSPRRYSAVLSSPIEGKERNQVMANTFLESLVGMFDVPSVGAIAGAVGSPEHLVSQGLKSSIAALLAGLGSKSQDTGLLRKLLNLGSSAGADMNISQIVQGASDPDSPLMS